MNSKSLFQSRTFWLNLLGAILMLLSTNVDAVASIMNHLNVSTATQAEVLAMLNIINRLWTSGEVHVVPTKKDVY